MTFGKATGGGVAVGDRDAAGRLYVVLARLTRALRRVAPAPLGHGAVSALATVVREGPMRLGDLATREGVRAPSISRIVALLENEGLAARAVDPADARAWLVRATPDGERLINGASSARARVLAERVARLTDEQQAALRAALPALEALCADETVPSPTRPPDGR
ncbi:MAG TPA: MarR family transcriptional regulator [Micromonosporaceae bacterium]